MDIQELTQLYNNGKREFQGLNLPEANLMSINLSGCDLSSAILSVSNLSGANLEGINLSYAKLNVARLSGANLKSACLDHANLNVANLINADLQKANLQNASLVRAELIRTQLTGANLTESNLSGADLREAILKDCQLDRSNISESHLKGAILTHSSLEEVQLSSSDLSRADLRGANLNQADLKQCNLLGANLQGASLQGANLRWANLTGANLEGANLTNAKLSGANLTQANLKQANLTQASLVHTDFTSANLIEVEWDGCDLSEAQLTGSKLYGVSRYNLKTKDIVCEWIDLSPQGDDTAIQKFTPQLLSKFFNEIQPKVQIQIEALLTFPAVLNLLAFYQKLSSIYPFFSSPPSIEVGKRRTLLTFIVDDNERIFSMAYLAILPFYDYKATHRNISQLVRLLTDYPQDQLVIRVRQQITQLTNHISQINLKLKAVPLINYTVLPESAQHFFHLPTSSTLINSENKALKLYTHPLFGKGTINPEELRVRSKSVLELESKILLPPLPSVIDFLNSGWMFGNS